MDKRRQGILDKIAKLLALAESTTHDGERDAARERIAVLLAMYGVELSELRNKQEIVIHTIRLNRKRINYNYTALHLKLANFSGCELILGWLPDSDERTYNVIGREVDINAAEYLMDVVTRQIEDLYGLYKKSNPKIGAMRYSSYLYGLVSGVIAELKRITSEVLSYQQQEGLVPVNEMEIRKNEAVALYEQDHKTSKSTSHGRYYVSEYAQGVSDAKKINLQVPVGTEQSEISAIN